MNKQVILISRYLDGDLNDVEVGELARALRDDPELVDRLDVGSFIHAQLLSWLNQDSSHGNELSIAAVDGQTQPTSDELFVVRSLRDAVSKSPMSQPPNSGGRSMP